MISLPRKSTLRFQRIQNYLGALWILNKARENLVQLADKQGVKLRQNYNRKGPHYALMAGCYAYAKQFKRMRNMNKKLKSRLGHCYLKGAVGDAIKVVMVAAGHNLRMILNKLRLFWLRFISSSMSNLIKLSKSMRLNPILELFSL